MSQPLTRPLARFVADLSYDHLPEPVVAQAKRFLMDALGCALAAHREDPTKTRVALSLVESFGARPQSSTFGGHKTAAALAALANGMLINAADNDDTHKRALAHLGSVVIPPALAMCEARGRDGKATLVAIE